MRKPLTWKEIGDTIQTGENLFRETKIELEYIDHIKDLKNKNLSITDYLTDKFFSKENKDKPYIITLNQYPYCISENIYHYLVWMNPNKVINNFNTHSEEDIKDMCKSVFGEIYFRQSPVQFRSVKSIVHYHVFSKTLPESILDKLI
jgi:predicted AlkP superfamily phosphohydrolase/phosphomutase